MQLELTSLDTERSIVPDPDQPWMRTLGNALFCGPTPITRDVFGALAFIDSVQHHFREIVLIHSSSHSVVSQLNSGANTPLQRLLPNVRHIDFNGIDALCHQQRELIVQFQGGSGIQNPRVLCVFAHTVSVEEQKAHCLTALWTKGRHWMLAVVMQVQPFYISGVVSRNADYVFTEPQVANSVNSRALTILFRGWFSLEVEKRLRAMLISCSNDWRLVACQRTLSSQVRDRMFTFSARSSVNVYCDCKQHPSRHVPLCFDGTRDHNQLLYLACPIDIVERRQTLAAILLQAQDIPVELASVILQYVPLDLDAQVSTVLQQQSRCFA